MAYMALIELILRTVLSTGLVLTGNALDPAATKQADKSVSEYQLNQCHVEK